MTGPADVSEERSMDVHERNIDNLYEAHSRCGVQGTEGSGGGK